MGLQPHTKDSAEKMGAGREDDGELGGIGWDFLTMTDIDFLSLGTFLQKRQLCISRHGRRLKKKLSFLDGFDTPKCLFMYMLLIFTKCQL